VRLVSYNIHACVGTDGKRDPGRIAAVLEALEPDVAALQEVDSRASRGGLDQAMLLARRLGMELVEGPLLREHRGHYGNAVLSRWPMAPHAEGRYGAQGLEPRGWLEVEIAEPAGPRWRILVTHLDLVGRIRTHQLAELAARLAGSAPPAVLAGDLNEWRPWRRGVMRDLRRVAEVPAVPASFPSRHPFLRLDRLALKGARLLAGPSVASSPLGRLASDHLPLWADLVPTLADAAARDLRGASPR
jgi:endonuclease/exonuclease/phosphatase family metal-dependent hydrolase